MVTMRKQTHKKLSELISADLPPSVKSDLMVSICDRYDVSNSNVYRMIRKEAFPNFTETLRFFGEFGILYNNEKGFYYDPTAYEQGKETRSQLSLFGLTK